MVVGRFLKQNHEISRLKNALAPPQPPPESEPSSPEFLIVPLKPTSKSSDAVPEPSSSTTKSSVNPSVSVSSSIVAGRVFVNSNLKPEEAGLVSGLEFGTIKFPPSAHPGTSSDFSGGVNISESVSSENATESKKARRRRKYGRSRSNSTSTSGNGEEPWPLMYTKTKPAMEAVSQDLPMTKSDIKSKVSKKNLQPVTSQSSVVTSQDPIKPNQTPASSVVTSQEPIKPSQTPAKSNQVSACIKPSQASASEKTSQASASEKTSQASVSVKPSQASASVKPSQASASVKPSQASGSDDPRQATAVMPSQASVKNIQAPVVKQTPASVNPSQLVGSPMKSSNSQTVNGVLGKILPSGGGESESPKPKAKNPPSLLQQQQLPAEYPRPLLPGPVFRPQSYPMMVMPANQGVAINPFFPLKNSYLPPPQLRMTPPNLPFTPLMPMPMRLLGPPGLSGVGQPNVGLVLPKGASDKDFYDLFAHFSNSGSGLRTQKEKLKRMTDEFLNLPVDKQMDCFILATTATEQERDTRQKIISELEHVMKKEYPNAKLYVFGSMSKSV